jgi:hypothetical protein
MRSPKVLDNDEQSQNGTEQPRKYMASKWFNMMSELLRWRILFVAKAKSFWV